MKIITGKKGFTLIELSVSSLIIALISLVLITVFRSNLTTWKWGQQHMEFNQKVQLVMKQIFTDLKNVNPILSRDKEGHLHFQGEKINDMFPNMVTIYDKDKNQDNGGEELVLFHTSLDDLSRKDRIRYYLEKGSLIRETQDYNRNVKKSVVAQKAADLFFRPDYGDIRQVMVRLTIINEKDDKIKETLDFAVRLETDMVCVKTVQLYD